MTWRIAIYDSSSIICRRIHWACRHILGLARKFTLRCPESDLPPTHLSSYGAIGRQRVRKQRIAVK